MKHRIFFLLLITVMMGKQSNAQTEPRVQPVWWFGESGAANFNFYRGTTQVINKDLTVPTAFHKGYAVKPYASVMVEYRPAKIWGVMLNVAYDNRGARFDSVMAPCNCPASLSANISYVTIEPSLRINPFPKVPFYIFGGPTISFVVEKSFVYTQEKQTVKRGEWGDVRKIIGSFQAGAGVDIAVSKKASRAQLIIAPFASVQSDFGRDPRMSESWSLYSYRAGLAIKVGVSKKKIPVVVRTEIVDRVVNIHDTVTITNTITVPGTNSNSASVNNNNTAATVPLSDIGYASNGISETFPLLNAVFFDEGNTMIPSRYTQLSKHDADGFNELTLVNARPGYLDNKRSQRQLSVYHNILNIIGARMQKNQSTISLTSSAVTNAEGLQMATSVRNYLVEHYGINTARIEIKSKAINTRFKNQEMIADERKVVINSTDQTMLQQVTDPANPGELKGANARFSVLFEFDQSLTQYGNEQFLIRKVVPLIGNNAIVIIHGHTDYTGNSKHNLLLSGDRAHGIEHILQKALTRSGKTNVQFEVYGFGEIQGITPFKNRLPEENYYNRTVTIDVIPSK